MAPLEESVYFPSLENCFAGGTQLIHFKGIFLRLADARELTQNNNLYRFLLHKDTAAILSSPFNPFKPPTPQTKSDFETKTAAINVTPAAHGQYEIDEIKQDTLWLSAQAGIDEISALRIVALEWQRRPEIQLLNGFSAEEVQGLQDAAGIDNFQASVGGSYLSELLAPVRTLGADYSKFLSTEQRQLRLLDVYLGEKCFIVKVSQQLESAAFRQTLSARHRGLDRNSNGEEFHSPDWIEKLGKSVLEAQSFNPLKTRSNILVQQCINAIEARVRDLQSGSGFFKMEDGRIEVEGAWQTKVMEEMVLIMQTCVIRVQASYEIITSTALLSWLRLMARCSFFDAFELPREDQRPLLIALRSLVAVTTLALLQLRDSICYLLDRSTQSTESTSSNKFPPYFLDPNKIAEIHSIFFNAAEACSVNFSPAIFAWGMILQTLRRRAFSEKENRELQQAQNAIEYSGGTTDNPFAGRSTSRRPSSSTTSLTPDIYEDLIEKVQSLHVDENFTEILVRNAVEGGNVFEAIMDLATNASSMSGLKADLDVSRCVQVALLDLIRAALNFMEYSEEIVSAIVCVLTGSNQTWDWTDLKAIDASNDPRNIFTRDPILMRLLRTAQARFPWEVLPFLNLCRVLATSDAVDDDGMPIMARYLENSETYTQVVLPKFQGWELHRPDENANFVSLTKPLDMYATDKGKGPSSFRGPESSLAPVDPFWLPIGTLGRVISDGKPLIISWNHHYSCLGFLGRWLEITFRRSEYDVAAHNEPQNVIITEIIAFFAALLSSANKAAKKQDNGANAKENAKKILEEASDSLDRNGDLVSVVFDIFEEYLQNVGSQSGADWILDPIIACMDFITAVLQVLPGRVWPYLARSSLLNVEGKGSMLSAIVSSIEAISGEYIFLTSCVRLHRFLIKDALSHAVLRKTSVETPDRFSALISSEVGAPQHMITRVLFAFGQTMMNMYESSTTWRFKTLEQQLEINNALADIFERTLRYTSGIDDESDLNSKLTAFLSPSATYLMEAFRSASPGNVAFNPLVHVIFNGIKTPNSTIYLRSDQLWVQQVESALWLSIKLVRAGRLLGHPMSTLEKQLFESSAVLVRLYVTREEYKLPVITLLSILISGTVENLGFEPASLLGRLGATASCNFLDILSNVDPYLYENRLPIEIWRLLSILVGKRQQWYALFILTGSSPRESITQSGKKGLSMRGKAFFSVALDSLAGIANLRGRVAIATLEFVAQAQENWPWATTNMETHPQFFKGLLDYVTNLNDNGVTDMDKCFNAKIASLVADISAVYLRRAKEDGDNSFVKRLTPSLSWYTNNAVEVSAYNNSLHTNLKHNFDAKYRPCTLLNFKRTGLEPRQFGLNYFYDTELGNKMLGYTYAWAGSRGQGFADELERANINLSLVEAEVELLRCWKLLAVEHSVDFAQDKDAQKLMATVVGKCLNANAREPPPEPIFKTLLQTRAEFALALLQSLADVKAKGPELSDVLAMTWKTMRSRGGTFEAAWSEDNIEYYRLLLNILFLAIQPHVDASAKKRSNAHSDRHQPSNSPTLSTILEILNVVVAQGYRFLTTTLHDESNICLPKDFAILTAILQSCLQVKDVDRVHAEIVSQFVENGTARHAAALYSWSDQLTIDGDPIYGELSILLILELSTIPMMAEELAVEGVLTGISSSKLTSLLRGADGIGPYDSPTRIFSIWAGGILPLCLNLLNAIGRGVAGEVAVFINQFEGQLSRATQAFARTYTSTPKKASEAGISLTMTSEANCLALISFILDNYRAAGASAGVDPREIPDLSKWDAKAVKEDIEEILIRRQGLRKRLIPTSETEVDMKTQQPLNAASGAESRLEEKALSVLKSTLICLSHSGFEGS